MTQRSFKTWSFTIAAITAVAGMGITMPSCPGQQAMQQQIDGLISKEAETNKKLLALDSQIKTTSNDMAQVKTLLSQVSNAVLAQKKAIEDLDAAVKTMQAQLAAAEAEKAKKAASGGAKKKKK